MKHLKTQELKNSCFKGMVIYMNNVNIEDNRITKLSEAANIVYLSKNNCRITKNGDFIAASINIGDEEKKYNRVWLHRSFPYDMPWNYISVQDKDNEEIGLIRDINDFEEDEKALICSELYRKYYTPKIKKILSLKETRGASFWKCETDAGEMIFTVQDTYRSIARIGADRAFITDACGNRFEIESLSSLDKKSMRRLEIYL